MTDCKTITFRPTPEAEAQIEALMKRWGCKRTQAILQAIEIAAHPPKMVSVTLEPQSSPVTVHGVVDPEKLQAFQRKTGMTVFDKRRNRG